jgi:hypothetical protein
MQRRFTYHHFKKPINFLRSCIFGLIIFFNCSTHAQSLILNYKVVQNSKVIGWIKLEKKDSGDAYRLLFDCETKKRFLILITVIEKQQSLFRNGIMMQSSVYRKINNDIKVNKRTTHKAGYYEINNKSHLKLIKTDVINYNQLSMYFFEPVNINGFYSELFDAHIFIKKIQAHAYEIELPDGTKNVYYYKNGICSKVKIVRSLFTAEFILSENF